MMKALNVWVVIALIFSLTGCRSGNQDISSGNLRREVFALVSSAENSSVNYTKQYSYIEDIGDGRGYTAGIIGFTSGTGDLLDVVKRYTKLKPDNPLKKYLPALKRVNGTDSHKGLGHSFEKAWKKAAKSSKMRQAQNDIVDEQYMDVVMKYAKKDGLSPLGQYIYYDACVVHGSGQGNDCFEAIRKKALKTEKPPSKGGDETSFLTAFLDARVPVMKLETAHSDLSRINAQRKFLREKNFELKCPLKWTMYGDRFYLTEKQVEKMK